VNHRGSFSALVLDQARSKPNLGQDGREMALLVVTPNGSDTQADHGVDNAAQPHHFSEPVLASDFIDDEEGCGGAIPSLVDA
jgi:hypothetical protein